MKLLFAIVLVSFFSLVVVGQKTSIASDFEKNKFKYKLEKFAEGEDASSGYDYLFYKDKDAIVKIRVIWSSSANPNYWIEDYYFNDGKLTAFLKYDLTKKNYKNAKSGKTLPVKGTESFYLKDKKLTDWTENGKIVSKDDSRWNEKETEILQKANDQFEMYKTFKEN